MADGQVKCVAMHSCAHATGLPLLPVVCLLVTMGMDVNEWLLLGLCYCKQCAQSARLSVWKKTRMQIFFGCIVTETLLGITPGLIFIWFFWTADPTFTLFFMWLATLSNEGTPVVDEGNFCSFSDCKGFSSNAFT